MIPYNEFYVGQDVVCIDDKTLPKMYLEIREGEVYKIRWIGMHKAYLHGEYLGVRLEGIYRGECPQFGDDDTPFAARRFRPLIKDRLAGLRSVAKGGPLQGDFGEPKRKTPVKEKEKI